MTVETVNLISDLNINFPAAGDAFSEGDDHLRNLKKGLKGTYPNVTGVVNASHTQMNHLVGVTGAIQTQLDAKAPSANPTFTGNVTLPATTAIGNVSATEIGYLDGVTSNVQTQIADLANSAGTVALQITASGSALILDGFNDGYDYECVFDGIVPTVLGANLLLMARVGGVSDSSAVYSYSGTLANAGDGTLTHMGSNSDSLVSLTLTMNNSAASAASGRIRLINPRRASASRTIEFSFTWRNASSQMVTYSGSALYLGTSPLSGVIVSASSGAFSSGSAIAYAYKRA